MYTPKRGNPSGPQRHRGRIIFETGQFIIKPSRLAGYSREEGRHGPRQIVTEMRADHNAQGKPHRVGVYVLLPGSGGDHG